MSVGLGEVWKLGRHRIMCGSSVVAAHKQELLAGRKVEVVLTDPPYCSGAMQEAKKSRSTSIGTTTRDENGESPKIRSDNLSTNGFVGLIAHALLGVEAREAFVFADWKMFPWCQQGMEMAGFPVMQLLIWDKLHPALGIRWRCQHECILYARTVPLGLEKGRPARGNVIPCKRAKNELHPTQKPVELLRSLLENSDGKTVYDPFLGSGSTLMACEDLGKTCLGMELDPVHFQTAVRRWEEATGKKAQREVTHGLVA